MLVGRKYVGVLAVGQFIRDHQTTSCLQRKADLRVKRAIYADNMDPSFSKAKLHKARLGTVFLTQLLNDTSKQRRESPS